MIHFAKPTSLPNCTGRQILTAVTVVMCICIFFRLIYDSSSKFDNQQANRIWRNLTVNHQSDTPKVIGPPIKSEVPIVIYDDSKATSNQTEVSMEITEMTVWGMSQPSRVKVSVYPPGDLISDNIRQKGSWEGAIVQNMVNYFKSHPELHFLDIGANLGMYSLNVASIRPEMRLVVAVDANEMNCKRLYQSLKMNGWTNQVTIVNNALDESRGERFMRVRMDNVGGTQMYNKSSISTNYTEVKTQAIHFDDLLSVTPFKAALMKMDIELSEKQALRKAVKFFQEIKIPVVMMEWIPKTRSYEEYIELMHFFYSRHYQAFTHVDSQRKLLNPENFYHWPRDMVWMLKDYKH